MKAINISIFVGLVLCGATLWYGLSHQLAPAISIGVVGGWVAMIAAIAVFAATLILLLIRVRSGQALTILKQSGLVIVNFIGSLMAIWLFV